MNGSLPTLMEDFHKVSVDDLQKSFGSRNAFRIATSVNVQLPGYGNVTLEFARIPANRGGGEIIFAKCPSCRKNVRVLRIVPGDPGLLCWRCVKRFYGAQYMSQLKKKRGLVS
jgi:hypothetical protein